MTDSTPVYSFTIPSVSDGTLLDCRIYHPASFQDAQSTRQQTRKAAVIAHPYAPLGGSMDDAVVITVVEQLLDQDFVVGTFNFRYGSRLDIVDYDLGAANSQGSTSWTGKAERDDYISVAGHLLLYINQIKTPRSNDASPKQSPTGVVSSLLSENITLILGGYSYGSLIVTRLPPTAEILAIFRKTQSSIWVSEILLRAKELALQTTTSFSSQLDTRGRVSDTPSRRQHKRQSSSQHSIVFGGSDSPSPADRHSTDLVHKGKEVPARIKHAMHLPRKKSASSTPTLPSDSSANDSLTEAVEDLPHVLTRYLLISPLLPPLSNFLSLSTSSLMFWRHADFAKHNFVRYPTLVIFGTKDVFTSSHKLDGWCKKMKECALQAAGSNGQSSFRWKKIEGAGHFWREHGVEAQLTDSLREWVHDAVIQ
ncbi:hypothetical protein E4T48_02233 [Aureobasidium sp. EXF-10727]|nr:hypothetical protein E4T48_02233 [Aureobasidium sp. EXF-10727]KAI4724108.1 hypothetical protein E4T49_08178 [Aureobasidium sp. EXF-10728]